MDMIFPAILVISIIAAVWLWAKSRRKESLPKNPTPKNGSNLHQQLTIQHAARLVELINDSLKLASDSKNADTKLSRLDLAKLKLEELKTLVQENSFISLSDLPKVESSMQKLEAEFIAAHYREAVDGNMRGQSLEKEGQIDKAIDEYESLIDIGVDTPFTYKRLAIIYSKQKKKEEEIRVLQAAIKNIPVENGQHYKWFAERLSKKS